MASNCSDLERSIEVLVKNFYQYAGKKEKMNRKEFRRMVGTELSHILTNTQSKEGADKLIKSLDANDDGKISFDEYWTLIGEIAKKLSQQMAIQNQNTQSKEGADKLIKSLDANDDGKISFDEYWTLVGEIAKKLSQQMAIQNQESG